MMTVGVDPRDIRWEMDGQVYRVYFWTGPSHPDGGWSCTETRVTDVDSVAEVLEWAFSHAEDRDVVVYLELEAQPGALGVERGLVRLHGRDPGEAASTDRRHR